MVIFFCANNGVIETNVLTFAGDLWQRTFDEVATEYPAVTTAYNHVDAACIYFVESPQRYDVIVTDNLFGDILTDLGGAISGGILGAWLFMRWQYDALLAPALLTGLTGLGYVVYKQWARWRH